MIKTDLKSHLTKECKKLILNFQKNYFSKSHCLTEKFHDFIKTYYIFLYLIFSYIVSGDADGKVYIWDWKTTKLFSKFKAHDNVCSSVLWHPHETSKVVSAGWDGKMKLWD